MKTIIILLTALIALWVLIGFAAVIIGRTYLGPVSKKEASVWEKIIDVLYLSMMGPILFDEVVSNYKFHKELKNMKSE